MPNTEETAELPSANGVSYPFSDAISHLWYINS